jgi:hypothetical protein
VLKRIVKNFQIKIKNAMNMQACFGGTSEVGARNDSFKTFLIQFFKQLV